MEIEEGLDIRAAREPALSFHFFKFGGLIVAPGALGEEGVEHKDFFVIRFAAVGKAPFEGVGVACASEHMLNDRRIFDAEEFADAEVGASAVFVIGGKLALCVEANLIEHAPEENDAANFFGGVSEPGDFHKRGDRS